MPLGKKQGSTFLLPVEDHNNEHRMVHPFQQNNQVIIFSSLDHSFECLNAQRSGSPNPRRLRGQSGAGG